MATLPLLDLPEDMARGWCTSGNQGLAGGREGELPFQQWAWLLPLPPPPVFPAPPLPRFPSRPVHVRCDWSVAASPSLTHRPSLQSRERGCAPRSQAEGPSSWHLLCFPIRLVFRTDEQCLSGFIISAQNMSGHGPSKSKRGLEKFSTSPPASQALGSPLLTLLPAT